MGQIASAILTYHSLDDSGSVISTPPDRFREQVEFLAGSGVPVVALADVQRVPGSVALTFDDGFKNFVEHGYPILAKHGLPATVFVVSGSCGGRSRWLTGPSPGNGGPELMGWSEIRMLAQSGIEIGAHTVHHPNLADLSAKRVEEELRDCRAQLEDAVGQAVDSFAYPFGSSTAAVRRLVERHFRLGCGTALRFVTPQCDRFNLPRIDMYYLRRRLWCSRLMTPAGHLYIAGRRLLRGIRMRARHEPWRSVSEPSRNRPASESQR
jgi:peptidoglycan/xylan/chitin deacetylase (PgdA/CDA1 family)